MFFNKNLKSQFNKSKSQLSTIIDMLKILFIDQEIKNILLGPLLLAALFILIFSLLACLLLDLSLIEAFWWVFLHLVDHDFLANDVSVIAKILGSVLIVCQAILLFIISFSVLKEIQKKVLESLKKGNLPLGDIDVLMIGKRDHCLEMINDFFSLDENGDQKPKKLLILDQSDDDDHLETIYRDDGNQIISFYKDDLILKKEIAQINDLAKIIKSEKLKTILFLSFQNQSHLDTLNWIKRNNKYLSHKKIYIEMNHLRPILAFDDLKNKLLTNHHQQKSVNSNEKIKQIKFINFYQEIARIFMIEYGIEDYIRIETKCLNIILYGDDSFAYAVVRQFMYQLHYHDVEINIYIKDQELFKKLQDKIYGQKHKPNDLPSHRNLSVIGGKFHLIHLANDSINKELLKGHQKIDFVIIAGFNQKKSNEMSNDDLAVSIAFRLQKQMRSLFNHNDSKIFIKLSNQEMNHLLYEANQGLIIPIEIKVNLSTAERDQQEKEQTLDLYPQKQHQKFREMKMKTTNHEITNDLLDAHKDWDELNEVIKNWNRHSYDHLLMKLKYIYHYCHQLPQYQQLECPTRPKAKSIAFNYKERIILSDQFKEIINEIINGIKPILGTSLQIQSTSPNDFDEMIENLVNMEQRRWLCEKVIDGFDGSQDLKELMDTEHFNIISNDQLTKDEIRIYGRSHLQQLNGQLEDLLADEALS